MKLFIVPIESYEERYTEQWSRWIPEACKEIGITYEVVEGKSLTNKVEIGKVLDVYGTHYYKYTQLEQIVQYIKEDKIKDDDIIFFTDLWFPGIEGLQYIKDMTKKKFKITGILHAGSYDRNDFTFKASMSYWARSIEQGWLDFFDKVFVGSAYHRKLIEDTFKVRSNLIKNTGLFFDYKDIKKRFLKQDKIVKEKIIVFPHRLDEEKQPELFDKLKKEIQNEYPDWRFIRSKDITNSRLGYYQLLADSKISVSFALQETFGFAMLESIACGCIPLVPKRLSYDTMTIYAKHRYSNWEDLKSKLRYFMQFDADSNSIPISELEVYSPKEVLTRMLAYL